MKKIVLAVFACAACLTVGAATFHVNPSAALGGDGTFANPFATLAEARDSLRAARKASRVPPLEPVEIVLAPGDYIQTESFVLDADDGGMSKDLPVTWKIQ